MKLILFILILLIISISHAFRYKHNKKSLSHHSSLVHALDDKEKPKDEKVDDDKPLPIPDVFPDKNNDSKIDFDEALKILSGHNLSKGEIKIIYNTIDIDKNNGVTFDEWEDFHNVFIKTFQEDCDKNKDYYLDKEEYKACLPLELKNLHKSGIEEGKLIDNTFIYVDKSVEQKLNFADFVFLKRLNIALSDCSANGKTSAFKLPCVLHVISPGRVIDKSEANEIFEVAFLLNRAENNDISLLDSLSLMNIAHLFYYFNELDNPTFKGSINKFDLIRGIDLQVLPITLTRQIVDDIFNYIKLKSNGLELISFPAFAIYLYTYRIFMRYSLKFQGLFMTEPEFMLLLKDPKFDPLLLSKIDISKVYTNEEIGEYEKNASGRFHNTERDYLISFLQTSNHKNAKALKTFKSLKNSKLFKKFTLPYYLGLPLPEANENARKAMYSIYGFCLTKFRGKRF